MKKFIERPSLRFVLASGANTLATYVLYLALVPFVPYRVAYTLTYIAGIVFGYLAQAFWVFQSKPRVQTALAYPLAYAFQYFAGIFLLTLFVEKVGIDQRLAPLLVVCITLPIMFLLTRFLFRKKA